jgi:hypothetical protein
LQAKSEDEEEEEEISEKKTLATRARRKTTADLVVEHSRGLVGEDDDKLTSK